MDSLAVCSALRHPVSKGWGIFSAFFPYLPGMPAMYGFLRHPTGKGWGVFSAFFPYLPAALPLHGFLRYPLVKGWGIYGNFLPYLWQTPGTFATLFPTSNLPLRPSSRSAAHHSAVFCTERSRECLAYRKMPVFCTGHA